MLDYEREEIIMKSSFSHGVTHKERRGMESRKGRDSNFIEENLENQTPNIATLDESPFPKIKTRQKNRDVNMDMNKSKEEEKVKAKVKDTKSTVLDDAASTSTSKTSRRQQSLKGSLLSSPTPKEVRRRLANHHDSDENLHFQSQQPLLANIESSLTNS